MSVNFERQISLGVSQATPLEDYDKVVAERSMANSDFKFPADTGPANDGSEACTFLCFASANKLLHLEQKGELNENWHQMVPDIFRGIIDNDLPIINQFREKRRYDA